MTEEYVPVRLSHLLRDCSVGAVVRGPDSLMVVQDIRTWDRPGADPLEREIRYVDRVRSALGIDRVLCAPPRSVKQGGAVIGWVPALRFPTWMRCLKCGSMHHAPWRARRAGDDNRRLAETRSAGAAGECGDCGGDRLEQTPWVLVHEDGYLADVPWHDLAHRGSRNPEQRQCRPDWTQSYLKLEETGAGRIVRCTRCESNARLRSGARPRIPFPPGTWQQPWMREPPAQAPETPALLLEINDVRVHSASTRTALVIPPESRIRRGTVTDRLYSSGQESAEHSECEELAGAQERHQTACSRISLHPQKDRGGHRGYRRRLSPAWADVHRRRPAGGRIPGADRSNPRSRGRRDFVTEHHTQDWKTLGDKLGAGARGARSTPSRVWRRSTD